MDGWNRALEGWVGDDQYWRRDAEATPHGKDLLDLAQRGQGRLPPITELLPWWGDDA
jgi:hypothetical protein